MVRLTAIALCAWLAAGLAAQSAELRVRNYYGVLDIEIVGGATGISVDVDPRARLIINPRIQQVGENVVVSGRSARSNARCEVRDGETYLQVEGVPDLRPLEDYPHVTVEAPFGTSLTIIDSLVFGMGGDLDTVSVELRGCGDFAIGSVADRLSAELEGTGNFSAASVRIAELTLTGSGSAYLGETTELLDAEINGSGALVVSEVNRDVQLALSGSGSIRIEGGYAERLAAGLRGPGTIEFLPRARNAAILLNGTGSITVGGIDGNAQTTERGGGTIAIGE